MTDPEVFQRCSRCRRLRYTSYAVGTETGLCATCADIVADELLRASNQGKRSLWHRIVGFFNG